MKYIDTIEARVRAATSDESWEPQKTDKYNTDGYAGTDYWNPAYETHREEVADFIAHARADIEVLLRVARAASKEVEFRKGNPKSKIFRHDVIIHGGIEHRVGTPCELCDALAALDRTEEK